MATNCIWEQQAASRFEVDPRTTYELIRDDRIKGVIGIGRAIRIPDNAFDATCESTRPWTRRQGAEDGKC